MTSEIEASQKMVEEKTMEKIEQKNIKKNRLLQYGVLFTGLILITTSIGFATVRTITNETDNIETYIFTSDGTYFEANGANIQVAIDSIERTGWVRIPQGTYYASGINLSGAENFDLFGYGASSIIINEDEGIDTIYTYYPQGIHEEGWSETDEQARNITVRDLSLYGNGVNGDGINISRVSSPTFQNLRIIGNGGNGIFIHYYGLLESNPTIINNRIESNGGNGIHLHRPHDVIITNNHIEGNDGCGVVASNVFDLRLVDNNIEDNTGDYGVWVDMTQVSHQGSTLIQGNIIEVWSGTAIRFDYNSANSYSSGQIIISNNNLEGGSFGIQYYGANRNSNSVIIEGNTLYRHSVIGIQVRNAEIVSIVGNSGGDRRPTNYGIFTGTFIFVQYGRDVTIVGNTVSKCVGYGIELESNTRTNVVGNILSANYSTEYTSIIYGRSQRESIISNNILKSEVGSRSYGILLDANSHNNTMNGNLIYDVTTKISDLGNDSIINNLGVHSDIWNGHLYEGNMFYNTTDSTLWIYANGSLHNVTMS